MVNTRPVAREIRPNLGTKTITHESSVTNTTPGPTTAPRVEARVEVIDPSLERNRCQSCESAADVSANVQERRLRTDTPARMMARRSEKKRPR